MDAPADEPARYFPFASGRYEVKPGLFRFGRDFGNGRLDGLVFQRDRQAASYLAAKREARGRGVGHVYVTHGFDEPVRSAACDFIEARLRSEYPDLDLSATSGAVDRFDALAQLVQEDLCVMRIDEATDTNWLAAAHLSFPNHWSPADKVGRDFAAVHEPVAHIERIAAAGQGHSRVMVNAVDGFVRFAWGITFDDRLAHHPDDEPRTPPEVDLSQAHVRVERQTLWGLPQVSAALFTIRTYLYRCDELPEDRRHALAAAIKSMSPQSRRYKGLERAGGALARRLEG